MSEYLRKLPITPTFREFLALITEESDSAARFVHAQEGLVDHTRGLGCVRGSNIYGPGWQLLIDRPTSRTRAVETVILKDATVLPNSLTVLDREFNYVDFVSENIGNPSQLADYDPHFTLTSGVLGPSKLMLDELQISQDVGFVICGPGFPNYGHFLYDGLVNLVLHSNWIKERGVVVVGKSLEPWQLELLEILGLHSHYKAIDRPTRFRRMVLSTLLSMHVSYPTRFARSLFDVLRFNLGASRPVAGRRVFITRGTSVKRNLVNRAQVESTFRELGFEIFDPLGKSVGEQYTVLSRAEVVAGEAGAGMANIGFCEPGAIVLEILPFNDQWTRGACLMLGHRWNGYFPHVNSDMSYSIDCGDLRESLLSVLETA